MARKRIFVLIKDKIRSLIRDKFTEGERVVLNGASKPNKEGGFVVDETKVGPLLFAKLTFVVREAERQCGQGND